MKTKQFAKNMRIDILKMIHKAGASHIASAFSCADILAVLYNEVLDLDEKGNKDTFILSKGHAGSAVYAALYEKGILNAAEIQNYYLNGSNLSGHISHLNVKGIDFSTGSLGHGICVAAGMALADRMNGNQNHVYVIVGDGECEEGSVWESAIFANHQKLDNLTVIVDSNKYQAIDTCVNTASLSNLKDRWSAFGWQVIEIDGHDYDEIKKGLLLRKTDSPVCVIANTIKGKGVSFMENNILWHYRDPQGEFFERALIELEGK